MRSLFEELVTEYASGIEESRFCTGIMLAQAIVLVARVAQALLQRESMRYIGPDATRRVERARILLENAAEPLSVEEVASRVGWSSDHLRRVFRTVYGLAPNTIQNRSRLVAAREHL